MSEVERKVRERMCARRTTTKFKEMSFGGRGRAKGCHMSVVNPPPMQVKVDAVQIGLQVTHLANF